MNPINPKDVSKILSGLSVDEQRLAWHLQALSVEGTQNEAHLFYKNYACDFLPHRLRNNVSFPSAYFEDMNLANQEAERHFYKTNIGHLVQNTLLWAQRERRCAIIQGEPGRGKSANCKACYRSHRGEIRVYEVPTYATQSDFFRGLAKSIGMPYEGVALSDIRRSIISIFSHSNLLLVLDEAQRMLPIGGPKIKPLLLEWTMDMVDHDVCVVLVGTDHLASRIAALKSRDWNDEQFKRRFRARFVQLPFQTDRADMENLAGQMFPQVARSSLGFAVAVEYGMSLGDVAGLVDLAKDAKEISAAAGRTEVTEEDIKAAVEIRVKNDSAMDRAFASAQSAQEQPEESTQEDCGAAAMPLQSASNLPADRKGLAPGLPAHLQNRFDPAEATFPARR